MLETICRTVCFSRKKNFLYVPRWVLEGFLLVSCPIMLAYQNGNWVSKILFYLCIVSVKKKFLQFEIKAEQLLFLANFSN